MIELAQTTYKLIKDRKYMSITRLFTNVHTPKGAGFVVKECTPEMNGGISKLCLWGKYYPETDQVFENILVDDCKEGAWQVYLLHTLWHSLPLFQHGIYQERFYLFSPYDVNNIRLENKEHTTVLSFINNYDVAPQIEKGEKEYFVSCCYWTNWGGLKRELIEITIENNKISSINEISTDTLMQYECGAFY